MPVRPTIFISYAHEDEPEKPAPDETRWLSFVWSHLRPAIKHDAVEVWIDRLMRGGEDWDPEIERKLRACDIFVLLVSRYSTSSDYIVDKEIAIIRERQAKGEDVHFYPLLLTPTAKIGLDLVRDKNLRPHGGTPFSSYSPYDRDRHMSEVADEVAEIAAEISKRGHASSQVQTDPDYSTAGSGVLDPARGVLEPPRGVLEGVLLTSLVAASTIAVSALRLSVGEDQPYKSVKGVALRRMRRTLSLRIENVSADRTIRRIKITVISIEPQDEYVGPWVLKEQLDLAAGEAEFVPLISFGEPYTNAKEESRYDSADTFADVLVQASSRPAIPKGTEQIMHLRATGFDTAPYDLRCKVWIDKADGRLRLVPL
jgi:hypothetical protein